MSVFDWVTETTDRLRSDGLADGGRAALSELNRGSWRILGSRFPVGTNVYDHDWDVLVILDACRVDILRELAESYDFLDDVESISSVGSHSREWMAKTFTPARLSAVNETAYVTGNVFSEQTFDDSGEQVARYSPFSPDSWPTVDADDFARLDEVWRDGWDDELGTVPPRTITDRVIDIARTHDPERIVAHYMQPHTPFVAPDYWSNPTETSMPLSEMNLKRLRRGEVSTETFLSGYRANLELVLDELVLLRQNLDAETVAITADHGEALGELGVYGHPIGFLHPSVKRVPWVETTATDTGEHVPEQTVTESSSDVSDRLSALGYV